ncbi:ABC transporter permease [Bacteroidota bacterium]
MIKNYFKTAIRNLLKYKGYSLINILGLTFGLVCTLFISIYIYNEITYDSFHEDSELIYRVGVKGKMLGNDLDMAVTASPMHEALKNEYPEISGVTRIYWEGGRLFKYGDTKFFEPAEELMFADSTFFEVFSFKILKGNPETALDNPFSIILTENYAKKYFGDEDPIGKSMQVENDTTLVEVTAVIEDCPPNSHFHFNMIGSLVTLGQSRNESWLSHNLYTYIKLFPNTNVNALPEKINGLVEKYAGPEINQILGISLEQFLEQGNTFGYNIQNIEDIHLNPKPQYEIEQGGNKTYVYVFSVIALLILVVACINFMNLSTARSTRRAREVGIRKVVGSKRIHLIYQFLTESIVLSFISLILAVTIVKLLISNFNNLIETSLSFNPFGSIYLILTLVILALFVGILSGIYPAFVLASFRPIKVLKGKIQSGGRSGKMRHVLVVIQFVITIIILLGTLVVFNQLKFMQNKDLGFEKEDVLVLSRMDKLGNQMEAFKHELLKQPNIINVSNSRHLPGTIFSNNAHFLEGKTFNDIYLLMQTAAGYEFADVLEMEMAEGRFFSKDFPTDSFAAVINESTARSLELENPLESRFMFPGNNGEIRYMPIIGVVKDFHFESMNNEINPVIFHFMRGNYGGYLCMKLQEGNNQKTIEYLEQTWNDFVPGYPCEYFWLENEFDKIFKPEKQTSKILIVFSIFSIFISCLGLFGLILFSTSQRLSEIGIRKTLGSSVSEIVLLLYRETLILMGIATIIAIPSYFIVTDWLNKFTFRFNFNYGIFFIYLIIISVFTLTIALLTISYQSIKAANSNPAEALRHE